MQDTKLTAQPRSRDFLTLHDDFSDFNAYCVFCDAVACLVERREEWLDDRSAEGLCLFSLWIKSQSESLKGELEVAWRARSQTQNPRH